MTKVIRAFCWHRNFVPWSCRPLTCGYIQLLNHEKMCIKSEVEEILFKLAKMTIVMRPSCWHQNFGPNGLSAPAQGLCLNFFSSITADFNIRYPQYTGERYRTSGPLVLILALKTNQMIGHVNFNINDWRYLIFWKKYTSKQVLHFYSPTV